jgi:hypothetical protein
MSSELTFFQSRTGENVERGQLGTPSWGSVDIIDDYSGFDHRVSEGEGYLVQPPTWVRSLTDRRRIISYRVAKAAQATVSRFFHDREGVSNDYDQVREHGHAAAYVERTVDAILGEDAMISIPGADVAVPASPPVPRKPDLPGSEADDVEREVFAQTMAFYEAEAKRVLSKWRDSAEEQPLLADSQEWINRWAEETHFWQTVYLNESEHVTPLGDGVLVGSIDSAKRPKWTALQPDAFFKAWGDGGSMAEEFPERVHLAWEFHRNGVDGNLETWVRRITYELLPTEAAWKPKYQAGMAEKRCYFSDGEWLISGPGLRSGRTTLPDIDDFIRDEGRFRTMINPFDPTELITADLVPLPLDWIPVVHVTHTIGNWGRSCFARVMALLDDMAAGDTAMALVANLCGEPPLATSGGSISDDMVIGAAALIDLGSDGKVAKLGYADELRALIEYSGTLERQFIKMTSLSSELSGRENREQSGRAIGLKMTPLRQSILRARLAREVPYQLVLKMTQRLAIVAGSPGFAGPVRPAKLKWGTFIPEDLSQLVQDIILLRDRNLLTDGDVYDLLLEAGMRLKDPDASLSELRSKDIRVAEAFSTMFGPEVAADYLGRTFDPADLPSAKDPASDQSSPSESSDPPANGPGAGPASRSAVGGRRQRSAPQPRP